MLSINTYTILNLFIIIINKIACLFIGYILISSLHDQTNLRKGKEYKFLFFYFLSCEVIDSNPYPAALG